MTDESPGRMERPIIDAAHELRTPLTRIRGELDLVLRTDLGDPPRSQLEGIREQLEHLSRLCGGLLLLARLDRQAGVEALRDDEIDLAEVVSGLLEQLAPAAHDRGVILQTETRPAVRVRASRPLLVEALFNVLDAAIQRAPADALLTVSMEDDGRQVQVVVAESGAHRGEGRVANGDGRDLGLAIARGVARLHGGRLEIDETPSGGSVLRLVLPASAVP